MHSQSFLSKLVGLVHDVWNMLGLQLPRDVVQMFESDGCVFIDDFLDVLADIFESLRCVVDDVLGDVACLVDEGAEELGDSGSLEFELV
jgi:hypothetical protein